MVKRSHNQLNEDEAHMRFIVASEQAEKLLIKKQQSLRELSKSLCIKIKFSPFINTHTDRVMSITGTPENIGSTIGSLVRTWTGNNDDSSAQFTIQMIIPEPMVAKIVGFKGYGLRKLHRKSGAAIEAIKDGLPDSTDRLFTATGVADSLHRAVYFTSLIFQEYTGLLKRFEQESSPYEPRDNINPLRRRITGTYTPPDSPAHFVSRKKKTAETKHKHTMEVIAGSSPNQPMVVSGSREAVSSACTKVEDLPQESIETLPCSPPPETEYKLASKRFESPPPSPLLLDTPVKSQKEECILVCPPSPPLSIDDNVVTKRLMVTCPMVGTMLSLSEELLNLMRQNSGAAIRVKEIVSHEQIQLIITGTKSQVSRVMEDLTLTTRNSYLFTKAIEQSECEYLEEQDA
ncbi:YALIA101S05e01310g1_1 [Yarrowia lipolytica]|nr:Hypothetical protein YALI2_E01744g [Yarrowia lipolytica]SEI34391.1 YALIA101S05e01310g1_1 [Yarrowia lipolytica]VBB79280.1 Conserved hypothetical protein [Yarrowia lipolytica]